MKIFIKTTAVILLFNLTFTIHNPASSQNVGISATGATPDISAMLDVVSTTKGMLIPRVSLTSLTDAATITTPATSLLVYNTNAALSGGTGYYYNAGTTVSPLWVKLLNTGAVTAAADAWLTKGNSGTAWNTNFLGTTDKISLRIRTNNVERIYIDSATGNVGISTTSPANTLDIVNTVAGEADLLRLYNPSNSAVAASGILFTQHGIQRNYAKIVGLRTLGGNGGYLDLYIANTSNVLIRSIRIDSSGAVCIGTTTPSQKLTVAGSVCATGFVACSDIRYKKEITPLPSALKNVMNLQGVNYYWKTKEFPEKSFTDEKQIGFIAQEIEKVYPEVVMTDKDGYKSVDYSRLTPVLVEAMKEQQRVIENLKIENASVKSNVQSLKSENQNTKAEVAELKILVSKLLQQNTITEAKK